MGISREEFEATYGRLPPDAVYIDLDATKTIERVTAGWSDTQIKGKSVTELDALIKSAGLNIQSLEESVSGERQRLHDLQAIRNRKLELGD